MSSYIMPEQQAIANLAQVVECYGLEFTLQMLGEICKEKAETLRRGIPQHIGTPDDWEKAGHFLASHSGDSVITKAR